MPESALQHFRWLVTNLATPAFLGEKGYWLIESKHYWYPIANLCEAVSCLWREASDRACYYV